MPPSTSRPEWKIRPAAFAGLGADRRAPPDRWPASSFNVDLHHDRHVMTSSRMRWGADGTRPDRHGPLSTVENPRPQAERVTLTGCQEPTNHPGSRPAATSAPRSSVARSFPATSTRTPTPRNPKPGGTRPSRASPFGRARIGSPRVGALLLDAPVPCRESEVTPATDRVSPSWPPCAPRPPSSARWHRHAHRPGARRPSGHPGSRRRFASVASARVAWGLGCRM